MEPATSAKICKLCGMDVSHNRRVKDPKGNYYCAECYEAATERLAKTRQPVQVYAKSPVQRPVPTPVPMPAGNTSERADAPRPQPPRKMPEIVPQIINANDPPQKTDEEISAALVEALSEGDLHAAELLAVDSETEPEELPIPAEEPATRPAPGSPYLDVPSEMPKTCPACGAPVIKGRRLCIKCNRDVTIPLPESMRGDASPEISDKVAGVVGKSFKIVGYLAVVLFAAMLGYVLYSMFLADSEAYQPYPKTRAQAIHQYLEAIAANTEKSQNRAFEMVSYRARTTNNPNERVFYKKMFTKMNEDLTKKYGKEWIKTVELDPKSHQDLFAIDDCEVHTLKIGKDEYTIMTQAQISPEEMIGNLPAKQKAEYPENGKYRFGVLQMAEYPVDWR